MGETPGETPHLPPLVTRAVADIDAIDTGMAGQRDVNTVYLIGGREPCLVECGPGADTDAVAAGLGALGLGPLDLAHVVVTHIHVDHAGGAGAILDRFPRASLWVHERGARHLVDPARLIASTARTYGPERMHALYGDTRPCPAERVRDVADGARIALGDRVLDVVHTPGHASHHIALHDATTGAMFTGEAIGTYLPWAGVMRPALPPPEVDVEAALRTIRRMRDRSPTALLPSHAGRVPDPARAFDRATATITSWSDAVQRLLQVDPATDEAVLAATLDALGRREFDEQTTGATFDPARYDVLGSVRMNGAGLARYWRKRWEAEAPLGKADRKPPAAER